jgi:acyl-CoA reductase-like NAD-dependent aldehyde dehydrogenase
METRSASAQHRSGEEASQMNMDVLNPATGETIAQVPARTAGDVDEAVERANEALPGWLDSTPGERAELLLRLADVIG